MRLRVAAVVMAATIAVSAVCASTSFAAGGIKGNGDSAGPLESQLRPSAHPRCRPTGVSWRSHRRLPISVRMTPTPTPTCSCETSGPAIRSCQPCDGTGRCEGKCVLGHACHLRRWPVRRVFLRRLQSQPGLGDSLRHLRARPRGGHDDAGGRAPGAQGQPGTRAATTPRFLRTYAACRSSHLRRT